MTESNVKSQGWVQLSRLQDPRAQQQLQSDKELLTLYVEGSDSQAIERLVERYAPMVASVCQLTVADRSSAEDAFQATFLVLLKSASKINKRGSVAAWLHGVAYRTSSRIRKQQAADRKQLSTEACSESAAEAEPIVQLARKMELEALDRELENLPEPLRAPLVEHYLLGASTPEIAERMEISIAAVEGRLKRGRRKLRSMLARRGISLSVLAAGSNFFQEHVRAADAVAWSSDLLSSSSFGGFGQSPPVSSPGPQISSLVQGELSMLNVGTIKLSLAAAIFLVAGTLGVIASDPIRRGASRARTSTESNLTLPARTQTDSMIIAQYGNDAASTRGTINDPATQQPENKTVTRKAAGGTGVGAGEEPENTAGWERPDSQSDSTPIWMSGGETQIKRTEENRAMLAQQIQYDLPGIPLNNAVAWLSEELDVQFILNSAELDLVGVDPEIPIQLGSGLSSAREILDRILSPLELAYIVRESAIEITSKDDANSSLAMRFYDLSYVLPNSSNAEALMNAIQQTVTPDSWLVNGGTSSVLLVGSMMIVAAPEATHQQIEVVLINISMMNPKNIEKSNYPPAATGGMGMGGMGGVMMGGMGMEGVSRGSN